MQQRRREEDRVSPSPSSKLRAQHRLEPGLDPYRRNRRDGLDQSPVGPIPQKNLSPLKADGVRRGGDGFQGRDYDWHLGGRRNSRVRSRSPPAEILRKRPHFDDAVRQRNFSPPPPPPPLGMRPRYGLSQSTDFGVDDQNLEAKRVYNNREKEFLESRMGGGQDMVDHKFVSGENEVGGSYRPIPEMGVGVTSQYEETGGHLPPYSRSVPMGRFVHERLLHRDHHLPMDKIPITQSHNGAEKNVFHARDVSYSTVSPPTYAKDYAGTSHLRDYGSSSMEMSRSDFPHLQGDDSCLTTSYDLSRNSGELTEGAGFSGHGQRPPIDTSRDPKIGQRNMMCHQQCEFSPTRAEHVDYRSPKLRARASQNERVYQYDDLPRRIAPPSRLEYEQGPVEYDRREFSGPYTSHLDLDRTGNSEDSFGNQRRGVIHEHPASQNPKYFGYHDMRRTSVTSTQGETYLHSGYNHHEIGNRMPQDYEAAYPGAPKADRSSILITEYDSRRDGLGLQQERFQNSPLSKHNSETYRQAIRVQETRQDIGIHDHSDRLMKRKYIANDEIDVHDFRTIKSSNWGVAEEYQDIYESGEWVDDEDMNMLYSSSDIGFNHNMHGKYMREYKELENAEDYPSDDRISHHDPGGHLKGHSFRLQKYPGQNIKHHTKSSSSSWHKSQHFSKRNSIHKKPKVWKKNHGYDENKHTANDEASEDWVNTTEAEPYEGSEEFKQLVHEAFLLYSKKLNLNSPVQRRYQDQGKAGSLYCIVCGKSSSKDFMDTRRLVTHAFMSHKAGLRAKHLGLHKAICVLMGWDTAIPQDTVTWVPQVLPPIEALAQKEDLILWPPIVIIHNISMSDDNPQNWKVVSMETIESFLRGKGFVRGRIKLCLGKPADQSIILVKFLGTFGGLGDAERLHKYLAENNRGRAECERVKSEGIKSYNNSETDQGNNVENILYGYVGIAEDFDKLDFNSKKWSMIKSRKEIDDLEKAPVKTDEKR